MPISFESAVNSALQYSVMKVKTAARMAAQQMRASHSLRTRQCLHRPPQQGLDYLGSFCADDTGARHSADHLARCRPSTPMSRLHQLTPNATGRRNLTARRFRCGRQGEVRLSLRRFPNPTGETVDLDGRRRKALAEDLDIAIIRMGPISRCVTTAIRSRRSWRSKSPRRAISTICRSIAGQRRWPAFASVSSSPRACYPEAGADEQAADLHSSTINQMAFHVAERGSMQTRPLSAAPRLAGSTRNTCLRAPADEAGRRHVHLITCLRHGRRLLLAKSLRPPRSPSCPAPFRRPTRRQHLPRQLLLRQREDDEDGIAASAR